MPDPLFVTNLFAFARTKSVSLLDIIPSLSPRSPKEFHGPCPWCGGDDRFIVWPAQEPTHGGRYHCRQCYKTGDGIQFLRDYYRWPFSLASQLFAVEPSNGAEQLRKLEEEIANESTLERARRIREMPPHDTLAERFQALQADIEMAQIGYEATVRVPDLYTREEKDYWEKRLSDLYAQRDSLEWDIVEEQVR